MKKSQNKTSKPWTMEGICFNYYMDNESFTIYEKEVYSTILRNTFGRGYKFCFLKIDDFKINRRTAIKAIKDLVERNIIGSSNTYINGRQARNKYELIEPKDKICNFIFREQSENNEPSKIIDESEAWK